MQPFRMSALELLSAYRRRTLSPVEAMASVIERVEAYEPHIHATWLYAPERALKEARASEARWAKGEPIGPLDGVPVTVKDNIATRGDPTPIGTAAERYDAAAGRTRRRRRGCARPARSSSPRRPCPTTACCRRGYRATTRWRAIRGSSIAIRADRRRAPAQRRRRSMARCTSERTSAARSACRPAGAEFFGLKPSAGRIQSIRRTSAASPAR